MEEASETPIATLLRTEGAPAGLPPAVPFSQTSTIVSMGRLETNQVALNDRKISKVHARLIVRTCKRKGTSDGEIMKRIFIKDQSTFGTFVNGKALAKEQWTMLQEGDVIGLRNPHGNASLGEYSVKYHDDSSLAETGEAPPAAEKQAIATPQPGGLMSVKQEVKEAPPAPTLTAVKQEAAVGATPNVSLPQRPPLMAVKEELTNAAPEKPQKAPERPTDPRQQVKMETGQEPPPDRPRATLPRPPGPKPTLPAPAAAKVELSAPGDSGEDRPGGLEECSPLEEEEDGVAAPLSPLSEVSEVSADDGTVPQPGPLPPGFLPPPFLGLPPGMLPPGMPTLPGLPGLPLGAASPAQLLAALRPGFPPLDATGRPVLPPPPTLGQMLPGINLANIPGVPRPPAPPAPVGTIVALPGTSPGLAPPGASATGPRPQLAGTLAEAAKPVVINVQQELIGMLIGKGGEVVKQLSKDSGARIEISKSATTDGPAGERTVYLSGSQDCIDRAKQMIEDTLNKAKERAGVPNNPNACTIKVPHELVGMLIGRGGETIKELKKESGARVDIAKEAADGNTSDRLVHISGPPECVEFAKQMVEDMLSRARERQPDRDRSRSPMRSERAERESATLSVSNASTQKTIKVAHELIGMLIGKGGDTIRTISRDSACRIEIAKDEAAELEEKRSVFLAGPPDCIRRAEIMIEDTLMLSRERKQERGGRRSRSRSKNRGGRRSRSRSRGGGRGKVMRVAQELIGTLIGKGGETIKAISKDTGARIEISKDERDEFDRTVSISGTPEQIDKAIGAIEKVLDEARVKMPVHHRPGRSSPPRSMPLAIIDNDFDDLAFNRGRSPIKESYLSEKVYIDEVEMPHRPSFLPEHEDGLPSDLEIFVKGLPKVCAERDLWEHLYRLGATDVKEILLLRRQKQSKGMAYVVFNRHDHAMMAKHKMNNTPASAIPCGGQLPAEEKGIVQARFSESERCINGRNNVYSADMVALLLGQRGKAMQTVKEQSGLRKVLLTGRNMKSYGQVDEDPRLHLVVYYEPDEVENVTKVIDLWGEQLGRIHMEIVDIIKGKGKGKGKFMDPMMHYPPPPHMMDFPRPPFMDALPPMRPPPPGALGEFPPPVEAPVLLQRRKLVADRKEGEATMTPQKVLEATCLRGRELRWQPWPEVAKFNEEWHALPMRWGLRGELFVLLRKRETGETKVCAAEVSLPLEKWPVLNASNNGPRTAKYKSFIFNEHLFLICLERESGILKVFHVPDPSSNWDVAFEISLPESPDPSASADGFSFSRRAKLSVFYAQDRSPHVLVVEPEENGTVQLFKIVDPGKVWTRRGKEAPPLSNKARVLPVYTKSRAGVPGDFEVGIFSVDGGTNELSIFRVHADTEKPWLLVSKLPFAGDTRLCCVYVPGKPEPLLMAGSPTERLQKLCHLNLIEWSAHKLDDRVLPPKVPVVEEKFSRQMSSLWPESRDTGDAQLVVATPIDCTADLPVSKHAWVTTPLLQTAELQGGHERGGPPGLPPGMPPGAPRPPFGRSPFEDPWGPYGGRPPFDPRGPPPFGMPPPPFGRPPFDPMGKGGMPPPGFDPNRPPFDGMPPPGAPPPPGFERPPFDAPPRPPFDMPPPGMPPFERPPHGRPPFDMPLGGRPPFDAPPGEWFGGVRPPFDMPPRPDGRPPFPGPEGQPPLGPMEVGSFVEADFRDQGRFLRAKIIAKHDDGTFDIEYDGDYVEWKVPSSKIRPLPPFPGPPPGVPPGPPGSEPPKEKRRHRHRRGAEGEEGGGDGGERRHHRHRRRGGEDREGSAPKEAAPTDAPPPAPANEEIPDGDNNAQQTAEDGGHRKRHRRRKRSAGREDDKEKEKERSKSPEAEPEQKKDRKRRHRSGERSRRKEAKDGAVDDSRGGAANVEEMDEP